MDTASVVTIIERLNGSRVRYLVVGGLAVVAHGYVRFTAAMDLVLDFAPDNLRRAVQALSDLGYKPRAPVPIEQFADEDIRRNWVEQKGLTVDQKGLTVFSLWSAEHPMTETNLFTEDPFEKFSASYQNAMHKEIAPGVSATFASLADMLELKRQAGRPRDIEDIQKLTAVVSEDERD